MEYQAKQKLSNKQLFKLENEILYPVMHKTFKSFRQKLVKKHNLGKFLDSIKRESDISKKDFVRRNFEFHGLDIF
jgi:hypothetical protein